MIKNLFSYGLVISIALFFVISMNSCDEEVTTLSRTNKIKADSIVRDQEKILKIEIDSLCKIQYQLTFDQAIDSISAVRLKEIEKYIPKKK